MPTLMGIPRELRDDMLLLALLEKRQPPRTVPEIEQEDRDFANYDFFKDPNTYSLTNPDEYTSRALPLLLTCKQLKAETQDVVKRFPITYELDIKFLKDSILVPTWTSIPVLSPRVQHVSATIQSLGAYERKITGLNLKSERHTDIWRQGCGGPPGYVWAFYSQLTRFLKFGPSGPPTESDIERPFTVNRLKLNFVDPEDSILLPPVGSHSDEMKGAMSLHTYSSGERNTGHKPAQVLRPIWLASNLQHEIESLLSMSYYMADYGGILYERIGSIVSKVNGESHREFDLGQMLTDLRFCDACGSRPWYDRVNHWGSWKQRTMEGRAKSGLKVVEPDANWFQQALEDAEIIYADRVR